MNMAFIQSVLKQVTQGQTLSQAESRDIFDIFFQGDATPAQIGGFLTALRLRGETSTEITGAVQAMRSHMQTVSAPDNAMDIVGTGGDGAHTLNISTATAIVVAACGQAVAKHGNRASSSRSGASDVLTELGFNLQAPTAQVEKSLSEIGIAFLMAPNYHSAMRHVAGPRKELAIPTLFNLLGPLTNPANVKRHLIGVYRDDCLEDLANVLKNLGSTHAWIVHGDGGLDEVALSGPTKIVQLKHGQISNFTIHPHDADLETAPLSAIQGGTPAENAKALKALLAGEISAYRHMVILNAACALTLTGHATDLKQGAAMAAEALDSKKAQALLARMTEISQETP